MLVVFFSIWICICLIVIILSLSTIRIHIENFKKCNNSIYDNKIENRNRDKNKRRKELDVKLTIWFLNRVKIFSMKINKNRINKINNKNLFNNINRKIITSLKENIFDNLKEKEYSNIFKNLNIELSKLDLNFNIGTEDVIITSVIVFFLSTAISIVLPHLVKRYRKDKYSYSIHPIYDNKNIYKIELNCIINIKFVHIMNILLNMLKRKRVDEKNGRTSNRRSYDHSYE